MLSRTRSLAVMLTLSAGLLASACATRDPTRLAAYQALEEGFQAVRLDANLGLLARQDPGAAAALHVAPIGPEVARFSAETQAYHLAIIQWLRKRELGTLSPKEPMPAGPTIMRLAPPPPQ